MPDIANAIPGVASFAREQAKAERLAGENFSDIPNWAKNWTPEEMETYVYDALAGITDLASAVTILQNILPKMAWMSGALRDYARLKREAS